MTKHVEMEGGGLPESCEIQRSARVWQMLQEISVWKQKKSNTQILSLSAHAPALSSLSCNMSAQWLSDRANVGPTIYQEADCQTDFMQYLFQLPGYFFMISFSFLSSTHTQADREASYINTRDGFCGSILYCISHVNIYLLKEYWKNTDLYFRCSNNNISVKTDAACDAVLGLSLFQTASLEDSWIDWTITLWLIPQKFLNWTQAWISMR